MFGQLKKELGTGRTFAPDDFSIPLDPQKFYEDVGCLVHPRTKQTVNKLASYQYRIWKDGFRYKYRLTIKSQKCGITTSSLYEDFQKALTTCKGTEILILAQNLLHAKGHISTLKKIIQSSKKYRHFLIEKPTTFLSKDEVSKITRLYIYNPDNPSKPTRIIGLGANESSIWSWKEVAHIHMSDVAAMDQIDDSGFFGAAFSRLANTGGTLHIETPPRGQRGKIWDIYRQSELEKDGNNNEETSFFVNKIPASMAVDAGLISQEFLDREKNTQGMLYGQLYECDFLNPSNTWYDESLIRTDPAMDLVD